MDNSDNTTVTTTAGESFTGEDSKQLARLIYRRLGRDMHVAANAWRRMLQNDCSDEQFSVLVGDIGASAESLLTAEERELILANDPGNRVRVCKMVRERTGFYLKDCLDLVNRYMKESGLIRTVFIKKIIGRKLYRCEVELPGGRVISQARIE